MGRLSRLGLIPTSPQNAAGRITEPLVCVPTATGTWPAATAAAEPEEEPPGVCLAFQGLRVSAGCMNANSVVAGLPSREPPGAGIPSAIPPVFPGWLPANPRAP